MHATCNRCPLERDHGIQVHIIGCPNAWLSPWTGKPYPRWCPTCGEMYLPRADGDVFCSVTCGENYKRKDG